MEDKLYLFSQENLPLFFSSHPYNGMSNHMHKNKIPVDLITFLLPLGNSWPMETKLRNSYSSTTFLSNDCYITLASHWFSPSNNLQQHYNHLSAILK